MSDNSTILISLTTRDKLKKFGHKGQTYDEVINILLEYIEVLLESIEDKNLENTSRNMEDD